MTSRPAPMSVLVMGQGYVGLPLAMRAVEVGHTVVGLDTNVDRVNQLAAGVSFVEDVPDSVVKGALESGRYLPTDDERHCTGYQVALITVPTPLTEGIPDLSFVDAAAEVVARYLRPGASIVLESTTYPGTTEDRLRPIVESVSGLRAGHDFHLGYSPERIDPGNRRWNLVNTPKVVSGTDERSLEAIRAFYDTIVDRTIPVRGPGEAELAKLIENTFRHVNIALVNELAMSARELGFDIWEAIEAAATKPFGFMRFDPGPGVGGHCLPIDPNYLSWHMKRKSGSPFRFVELANDVNDHMPSYVVQRLILGLNRQGKPVKGSRILVLGLAYKADSSDLRESPALVVVERLVSLGAVVRVADPLVDDSPIPADLRVEADESEISAADAVVLLTPHSHFPYDLILRHARYVLDTRHRMDADHVEQL